MRRFITHCVLLMAGAVFLAGHAVAGIPVAFSPLIIEPPFSFAEKVVDITPALNKARTANKPLLLYVGAHDCPPCKAYGIWLEQNEKEMLPHFNKFVVAEVRTWIKGPKIIFAVNGKRFNTKEFYEFVGDSNTFAYPSWMLLDANAKIIKQLPHGANAFMDLEKHKDYLTIKSSNNATSSVTPDTLAVK
jgi:thiol-disulfide isomerase/thioredoxin